MLIAQLQINLPYIVSRLLKRAPQNAEYSMRGSLPFCSEKIKWKRWETFTEAINSSICFLCSEHTVETFLKKEVAPYIAHGGSSKCFAPCRQPPGWLTDTIGLIAWLPKDTQWIESLHFHPSAIRMLLFALSRRPLFETHRHFTQQGTVQKF